MHAHSDRTAIIMWLKAQQQALDIWTEEILFGGYGDADLLERLDDHRRWLQCAIGDLERKAA